MTVIFLLSVIHLVKLQPDHEDNGEIAFSGLSVQLAIAFFYCSSTNQEYIGRVDTIHEGHQECFGVSGV